MNKTVHLINGLWKGGAETMLYQILKFRTGNSPQYCVISLGLAHYYEESIRGMGIELIELDLKNHPFKSIIELNAYLKKVDTLCCWMYISNLLGYLLGRKKVRRLIWCIRHSDLSKERNSYKTLMINRICSKLSSKVDLITYNGLKAREVHRRIGYKPLKDCVLENGLDLSEYYSDKEVRCNIRRELGIKDDTEVVLSVSKNHPIKDLPTFIDAFAILKNHRPEVVAVMCGQGVDDSNDNLCKMCAARDLAINKDIYLLGFKENVMEILNGGDVFVLHSAGEAFPNTLIQAMACEIPVVSTDVGDVKRILEDDMYVTAVGDSACIADKVGEILDMNYDQRKRLTTNNRTIVEKRYNIENIVKSYEASFVI